MKLPTQQMTTLKPTLSLLDAFSAKRNCEAPAIIVGLVIGAGIFETPSFVAANAGSTEIALLLVIVGSITRQGFETMVDYTAPAFWFFFLLSGISLLVMRRRDAGVECSFKVPFYPLTPLLFCGICVYMPQASLAYTGWGGLLGVIVLLLGLPLLWWNSRASDSI